MQDGERLLAHTLAEPRIEAREGLVHQQHARPRRNGASQRHALLLSARKNMRVLACVVTEPDPFERGKGFRLGLAPGERFQAEGDIVEDGEVREQREVLEHEPDATLLGRHEAVGPRHLLIVDQHAASGGPFHAGGDAKERGLAAARRPEQADDLARRDVEADMIEREPLAEAARDVLEGEPRGEGDGGLAARGLAGALALRRLAATARVRAFRVSNMGAGLRGSSRPAQP